MAEIINKEELKKKFDNKEDFQLLDVAEKTNFKAAHIIDAMNLELENLLDQAESMLNKNKEIVVYGFSKDCNSDLAAASWLQRLGFKDVKVFKDGIEAWHLAGLPLVYGKKAA